MVFEDEKRACEVYFGVDLILRTFIIMFSCYIEGECWVDEK